MSGLSLNMGLNGNGAFGSGFAGANVPAAAGASPQGPTTIGAKAFGISSGAGGERNIPGAALLGFGTLALLGLVWIYYSLPR